MSVIAPFYNSLGKIGNFRHIFFSASIVFRTGPFHLTMNIIGWICTREKNFTILRNTHKVKSFHNLFKWVVIDATIHSGCFREHGRAGSRKPLRYTNLFSSKDINTIFHSYLYALLLYFQYSHSHLAYWWIYCCRPFVDTIHNIHAERGFRIINFIKTNRVHMQNLVTI